jgi:hypothetical protein
LDDELGSLYQNYDPLFGIKFNELSDSPKFAEEFGTEGSSKLGVDVLIFESAEDFSIWCLKFSG